MLKSPMIRRPHLGPDLLVNEGQQTNADTGHAADPEATLVACTMVVLSTYTSRHLIWEQISRLLVQYETPRLTCLNLTRSITYRALNRVKGGKKASKNIGN